MIICICKIIMCICWQNNVFCPSPIYLPNYAPYILTIINCYFHLIVEDYIINLESIHNTI